MHRINMGLRELKVAGGDAGTMEFSGYGAAFNNVDYYGDVILPGAFADYLSRVKSGKDPWPLMLLQHGGWGYEDTPIGIWLDLSEDGSGLRVTGKLADTPRGREVYSLMKMEPRPAFDGLSIGYIAKEWEPRSKPEESRRQLKRIDLVEISPVSFPANEKARVDQVKSALDESNRSEIKRIVERTLRDAGFSREQAKAIVAEGCNALSLRDAEAECMDDELSAILRRNIAIFS